MVAKLKPNIGAENCTPAQGSSTSALTLSKPKSSARLFDRLKDVREECYAQSCEVAVANDSGHQQRKRWLRFHARWKVVRAFYVTVTERLPKAKQRVWLRLLIAKIHDMIVGFLATIAQVEIACTEVLHSLVLSPSAWREVLLSLREALTPFQRDNPSRIDYREFVCACIVLDRWQDGELRMLTLWMGEYSLPIHPVGDMVIHVTDVRRMLLTPCAGTVDEQSMEPLVAQVVSMASSHTWIRATSMKDFAGTSSSLRSLLKELCWRRLVEDMRLDYFRNAYLQAMDRVEREEAICRAAAAMQLWQLREPRVRFKQWKVFVVAKKLMHRGDEHYRRQSRLKVLFRLRKNQQRVRQMKRMLEIAGVAHCKSLLLWTLSGWRQFCGSMRELHRASLCRSAWHHQQKLILCSWWAFAKFTEAGRSEKARRQVMLDQFISCRERTVMRNSWEEWLFVFRRQKEVRSAMLLEHQLHGEIRAQRQEEAEGTRMAVEDAHSQSIREHDGQFAEQARQRAFQEATERAHISRKLRQQKDMRMQFKKVREERFLAEMEDVWARIGDRVAAEVRSSTIAWFSSSDGTKAVHTEASEIFEHDPAVIQNALIQDPQAYALPGCRWQLRLEDYGGRFAKPFYINTDTLEKFVCDELVIDNCEAIAREVIIQRKIDDARMRLRVKADTVYRERQRHEAAIKIQMLFRCRHALLIVRGRIRSNFVKRIEPTSGDAVYFNISTQTTRRRPPGLIGSDEPLIPVESSTWVRRADDDGNNYYLHLGTGETSCVPPAHHLMCVKCKQNFATRRWNETGRRYCVVCYAEGLKKTSFVPVATWTKLTVQPAMCVVCRNSLAEVECHECRGDVTCWKCCQAVHRNPRLVAHREMTYLMHSSYLLT